MAEIQLLNVPDDLMRRLQEGAEQKRLTVSDFILLELQATLSRPSRREVLNRLADLPSVPLSSESVVGSIRAERDAR